MTQFLVASNLYLRSVILLQILWLVIWDGADELGRCRLPWNRELGTR